MCIIYTACNEKTTTIALFSFLHYTLEIHAVCAPGTKKLTALLKLKKHWHGLKKRSFS